MAALRCHSLGRIKSSPVGSPLSGGYICFSHFPRAQVTANHIVPGYYTQGRSFFRTTADGQQQHYYSPDLHSQPSHARGDALFLFSPTAPTGAKFPGGFPSCLVLEGTQDDMRAFRLTMPSRQYIHICRYNISPYLRKDLPIYVKHLGILGLPARVFRPPHTAG